MLCQHNLTEDGNQVVAVENLSLAGHHCCPVHIRVKNDAQISLVGQDGRLDAGHGFLIVGIWNVIGEGSVRIQKL